MRGYFTVFVGVVAGLVPSKLAGVELGCVTETSKVLMLLNYSMLIFNFYIKQK